jgi:WD40 repeat protein
MHVLNLITETQISTLEGLFYAGGLARMAISQDALHVVRWCCDQVQLWDSTTGVLISHLRSLPNSPPMNFVSFSPNGARIAIGDKNGCVEIWDSVIGTFVCKLDPNVDRILFSPDGVYLCGYRLNSSRLHLWNPTSGVHVMDLKGVPGSITSIAFSPQSTRVVSGNHSGSVILWDLATTIRVELFHAGRFVNSVAFSPDDETIVVGFNDFSTVVLNTITRESVNMATQSELATYRKSLATFSADGGLVIHTVPGQLLEVYNPITGTCVLKVSGVAGVSSRTIRPRYVWDNPWIIELVGDQCKRIYWLPPGNVGKAPQVVFNDNHIAVLNKETKKLTCMRLSDS